jgi:hypothetical protein
VNEQRDDAGLVDSLEHLLGELERTIDARLPLARADRIEADRLFVVAGELDAALRAASTHLRRVRSELEGASTEPS